MSHIQGTTRMMIAAPALSRLCLKNSKKTPSHASRMETKSTLAISHSSAEILFAYIGSKVIYDSSAPLIPTYDIVTAESRARMRLITVMYSFMELMKKLYHVSRLRIRGILDAMESLELLIVVLLVAIFGVIVYVYFLRPPKEESSKDGLMLLQQRIEHLTRTMDERMGETTEKMYESVQEQFTQSQRAIREVNEQMIKHMTEVTKGVTEANEAGKQIFTVAEGLKDLEKVLKHQKQRGTLGEASLQLALENMLPATAYKLQYPFPDGSVVDAVVMTKDGIIPVDAKFSLDNYRRLVDETDPVQKEELEKDFKNDLKKRIDETAKYIRPKDGTLPFAFMYIPAEAIYYDLLVNEVGAVKVNTRSLIDYAYKDKNVIIVSPTTFAAYLQSVLYGFRAFKIEESAKQIGKQVESLSRHLAAYDEYFKKLGNSLSTSVNHYNAAQKELGKVDKDVMKITGESMDIEQLALEKPNTESD